MQFTSPVHFGQKRLSDSQMTIKADTLFSALFIEALHLSMDTRFLLNDLTISDTFPYQNDVYYVPKPLIDIKAKNDASADYKQYKNMTYIPYDLYRSYVRGEVTTERAKQLNDAFDIGISSVQTKVMIPTYHHDRMTDDSEPYTVGTFSFYEHTGLYFIIKTSAKSFDSLQTILQSLQYSGIGGKRSTGYGQFTYEIIEDDLLLQFLQHDGKRHMLLSTAMATEAELNELDLAGKDRFILEKRSGFIQSTTYASTLQKKRDFYSFAAGSVFQHPFTGDIYDVSGGGKHPVYRYAKALWLGV